MTRTTSKTCTPLAAAAALLALASGAQAQVLMEPSPRSDLTDADTLQWRAGVQLQRDDNVFKQPDNTQSDNITVGTVGVRVNKPWSLQRLELDVRLDDYRYDNYSALNFSTLNYEGAFRWAVTPRLRGNVTADRREYIDRFTDVTGGNLSRRTEKEHGVDAEYEVGAAWRALAGVFDRRITRSGASLEPDTTVQGGEVGARYDFRSGNSLGYRYRQGNGEYSGDSAALALSDFTDRQHEFELQWRPTGQIRAGGRLGWLERDHADPGVRDFSGWAGRLNANWTLTGKTSLAGGLIRELAAFRLPDASYYEGYRIFIAPEWKPTVKTAVRLRFDHGMRTYKGSPVPTLAAQREDRLSIVALALEWEPIRAVRLMATVQRDERNSNRDAADYKANVVGIAAQASF